MRLKLISPSRYVGDGRLLRSERLLLPSLTLPLLAALAPRDIEVSIHNELFEAIDLDGPADLVGITATTLNVQRAYELADAFRARGVPVVMGGLHVTLAADEAAAHADTLVLGEADETWPAFLTDFRRGAPARVYRPERPPSLDNLPVPRFSLLDKYRDRYVGGNRRGLVSRLMKPIVPVQTARGCPNRCTFCAVTRFSGATWRARPAVDVVSEIQALDARFVAFVDDNIFANPERAKDLFARLVPLEIRWAGQGTIAGADDAELVQLARQSGCVGLFVGLESICEESLAAAGKRTNRVDRYARNLRAYRRAGIAVDASMVFGFDGEPSTIFADTYRFLVRHRVPFAAWQPIRPYPGTPLYDRLREQGRLLDERWWLNPALNRGLFDLVFRTDGRDREHFTSELLRHYRRLYSPGSVIRRALLPPGRRAVSTLLLNLAWRRKLTDSTSLTEY